MKELPSKLRMQIRRAKTDAERYSISGRLKERKRRAAHEESGEDQREPVRRGARKNGVGIGDGARALSDDELKRRKALIPEDRRDFTARFFGDPIPGDPRRQVSP